jgi:hypothetical protein
MSRLFQISSSSLLSVLAACAEHALVETEPEPAGASALAGDTQNGDALLARFDHGELSFETPVPIVLNRRAALHTFQFTLTAPAHVDLRTMADASGQTVDTVLSLLREPGGQRVAVNDDAERSRFSRVVRGLSAGAYRVVVQGFKRSLDGSFQLSATCSGSGCPPEPARCLFGSTFYELRSEQLLTVLEERWLRALSEIASELEGQQLLIAVQQSSHTDVTTPAEALSVVDQNEVRRMRLRDAPSGREYDVFEYGAGDNSYGAIFSADSLLKVASIHDGDLYECSEL